MESISIYAFLNLLQSAYTASAGNLTFSDKKSGLAKLMSKQA